MTLTKKTWSLVIAIMPTSNTSTWFLACGGVVLQLVITIVLRHVEIGLSILQWDLNKKRGCLTLAISMEVNILQLKSLWQCVPMYYAPLTFDVGYRLPNTLCPTSIREVYMSKS